MPDKKIPIPPEGSSVKSMLGRMLFAAVKAGASQMRVEVQKYVQKAQDEQQDVRKPHIDPKCQTKPSKSPKK